MKKTIEPIIIQQLGISGRIKETYFGILINGKPNIIKVDTLEELLNKIKEEKWDLVKNF